MAFMYIQLIKMGCVAYSKVVGSGYELEVVQASVNLCTCS